MASLSLTAVSKSYDGTPALRSLSLEVADGEFVAVVGPSGCGKSTLLHLVAGLERPDGGTIAIGGRPVNERSPRERDVALVFQSYALYPHLDVRRNLAFPLEVSAVPRREVAERVRETAAFLGLEPLLGRRPAELSGGQRQRVALGRALIRRPSLFLFDEPLSNLDAALRVDLRGELKKLHERLGATFLYVTHDQGEALTLADRVAVLRDGALQQVGSPREVYTDPANVFVGSFVGTPRMNLVPPEALGLSAAGALAGIRPEQLSVALGAAPPDALPASIWLVEPAGAESWVTLALGETRVVARAPADFEAPPGAAAHLRFDRRRVLWFDQASGIRRRDPSV